MRILKLFTELAILSAAFIAGAPDEEGTDAVGRLIGVNNTGVNGEKSPIIGLNTYLGGT